MAASSLLALIDDIATLLDDVAVLSKVATQKTAGVLGDDLALNAEQVAGVTPDRELPVVWAVAKGSALNKAILVPLALLISAIAPWLILPLLMVGGAYLCYEGFHKIAESLLHAEPKQDKQERRKERVQALADPKVDLVAFEKAKIKGAIRTDFILSAEIVVITLGTVAKASLAKKAMVLCVVALLITALVYGLVGAIVKLDDAGLALSKRESPTQRAIGRVLLVGAPYLMKGLSIVGTAAMFLVGGGIVAHGIPAVHHAIDHLGARISTVAGVGGVLSFVATNLANAVLGLAIGGIAVLLVSLGSRIFKRSPHAA